MSNEELCELIQKNSLSAYDKLYQNNVNLLYSLINRFYYNQDEKDDLLSCAKIALFNAAKKYDAKYGALFSTFAVPIILGEIKKYFRESLIHVSRGIKDTYRDIMKAKEDLEMEKQRPITLIEISNYLSIPLEDVLFAYESNQKIVSLDSSLNDDDETTLLDIFSNKENSIENRDLKIALDKLSRKERLIIELRYYDGYSQQEVANRLFTSQVQISRIEKKILEKLKTLI